MNITQASHFLIVKTPKYDKFGRITCCPTFYFKQDYPTDHLLRGLNIPGIGDDISVMIEIADKAILL